MAIKPILFNTDMVRAILDGRKRCTRRLVRKSIENKYLEYDEWVHTVASPEITYLREKEFYEKYPPYQPGDILYVREAWMDYAGRTVYKADCDKFHLESLNFAGFSWHPSIHMPKEAARIWLRVTDVRVERLQEITGQDVLKEGLNSHVHPQASYFDGNQREMFENLWNGTVKKSDLDRYGWDASPWVWVIEFERCEKPEGV